MESSTRMPTASDRPSRESVFSVKPSAYIGIKVAIIEVGIAIAMMMVPRMLCRKRKTISTASSAPRSSETFTSLKLELTVSDWSVEMVNVMSGGRIFPSFLICSLTPATAASVLPSVVFRTSMPMDGWPFRKASCVCSEPVSSTVAMSPSATT